MHRDLLADLLVFYSSRGGKTRIPLAEYVEEYERRPAVHLLCTAVRVWQSLIQTATGGALVRDKGYEILYLTEDVDEFVVKTLMQFEDKEFKSVNDEDLGLETEEEKKATEELETEYKDVLDFVRDGLGGKIAAAKLSHKLKSAPVCLTTQGGVSLEMERYFAQLQGGAGEAPKAERVLELNASHPVFQTLKTTMLTDPDKAKKYAELLYG